MPDVLLDRINALRVMLSGRGLEAVIITKPENIFYLTGFTGSHGSVVVTGKDIRLITDFRYDQQASLQSPHCKIVIIKENIPDTLCEMAREMNIEHIGCEGNFLTYHQYTALKENLQGIELKPLQELVEELRTVKDSLEVESIGNSVKLSDQAFEYILPMLGEGVTERAVALEIEFFMKKNGAESISFPFIVASGQRSSMPHGTASEKIIARGDLVTLDFGAMLGGYNSDITRTVVIGQGDNKQEEIYSIVLEAQMAGIKAIKAGIQASEVDRSARGVIEGYGYGQYFGHSTGHGLGLQIHEHPRLSSRDRTVLKPGMVVTVEPGIYLPGWGGIRIEDTVVVEETGCRILTSSAKDRLITCGS